MGSGGLTETANVHASIGGGESAAVAVAGQFAEQLTSDVPIGNAVPDSGAQEIISCGVFGIAGASQDTVTGNASSDFVSTAAGHVNAGGLTSIAIEQGVRSVSSLALHVTVVRPSPNTDPEEGVQEDLSTDNPFSVGKGQ